MTLGIRLALTVFIAALGLPSLTWAVPIQTNTPKLPPPLQKLPTKTAVFVHLDVAKLWDHPTAKPIRTIIFEKWAEPAQGIRAEFGIDVENIKTFTVVLGMGTGPEGDLGEHIAVFLTTRESLDRKAVARAWRADPKYIEATEIPDVVPLQGYGPRTLRFLGANAFGAFSEGFDEVYAQTQPFPEGREPRAIREAASGQHAAVVWFNLARLKDAIPPELRNAQEFQPFMPVLMCREALLTAQIGDDLRAQGRLILGTADAEEVEKGAKALKEFAIQAFGQQQARLNGKNRGRDAVPALLLEMFTDALKSMEIKRDSDVITATAHLKVGSEFVTKLEKAVEAQVNGRLPARRANNLKQLALSMHNYESANQRFPAAGSLAKNEKPRLSWRVAILPYIEEQDLYRQFKFDEPWDSEHNLKLLKKMPEVFALPGVTKPGDTKTHYRVFVPAPGNKGPLPMFARTTGARITDITDGTSNTLMLAESAEAVPWTKPEPMEYDAKKPLPKLFFDEHGRGGIALGDGSVRMLRKTIKADTLRKLITRNDGQAVDSSELE